MTAQLSGATETKGNGRRKRGGQAGNTNALTPKTSPSQNVGALKPQKKSSLRMRLPCCVY